MFDFINIYFDFIISIFEIVTTHDNAVTFGSFFAFMPIMYLAMSFRNMKDKTFIENLISAILFSFFGLMIIGFLGGEEGGTVSRIIAIVFVFGGVFQFNAATFQIAAGINESKK